MQRGSHLVSQAGHVSLVVIAHAVLHDAKRRDQHGHTKRDAHGRDHKEISHNHLGCDYWAPALQVLLREAAMEMRPFAVVAASLLLAAEQAHASGRAPARFWRLHTSSVAAPVSRPQGCPSHNTGWPCFEELCLRACEAPGGFWQNRVQLKVFKCTLCR